MRRFCLGIWSRLLLAFGTIAGITIVVATVALLIFQHSGNLFTEITEKHVPDILQVAEFAEIGGEIIAIAPNLLAASNEDDRNRIAEDIDRLLLRIDRQVSLLLTASSVFKRQFEDLTNGLKENLLALQYSVVKRLELQRLLNRKTERLRWLYADLIGELDPLNQDYAYNLDTEIERIIDAAKRNEQSVSSVRLQANRQYKEAIEQIRSNGVLLVGLMVQAATSGNGAQIDSLASLSSDTAALLGNDLRRISDDSSTLTLKQVMSDLFHLAEGDQSVFAVKARILESEKDGREALTGNRMYVIKLRTLIDQIVSQTQKETFSAVENAERTLAHAGWLLIAMVILSILVAGSVLWFYVQGNIVARLAALSRSMLSIADGDLACEVPAAGKDEIGRMSAALKVFQETALAVEEANAQAIIDNAAVGLVIATPDGSIHFFNPMAAALFGADSEVMIGTSLYSIVAEKERETFAKGCLAVLSTEGNKQVKYTFHGLRRDDTLFPIDVSICRVHQRKQRRLIVTVHDVTEREEAELLLRTRVRKKTEHLSRINVRLREEITERRKIQNDLVQAGKLAALGQLSAGIAHEMNQPLSAMRYYLHNAEKLLERGEIAVHRENLAKISDLIERMAKMISHLKTFARYQKNRLEPVDVVSAVEHALALVTAGIKDSGVLINKTYTNFPVFVSADAIRLEQVFVNIVNNALDAVCHNPPELRCITINIEQMEEESIIAIFDNGPGIAEENCAKIFDPFFTTKEVGQGLGLGLSISYNIIKGFGGTIGVSAVEGGGACFSVSLENIRG
jgi:two-component system phosphoglycerate transport system sensor histidine kinase PgtB